MVISFASAVSAKCSNFNGRPYRRGELRAKSPWCFAIVNKLSAIPTTCLIPTAATVRGHNHRFLVPFARTVHINTPSSTILFVYGTTCHFHRDLQLHHNLQERVAEHQVTIKSQHNVFCINTSWFLFVPGRWWFACTTHQFDITPYGGLSCIGRRRSRCSNPRGDAGGLSREYVLRIPSVS